MTRVQFEKEVRENQEPLRRFLMNLCSGNSSLGDDIAQEAFIKAYTRLDAFNGKSKFSTWLFRIAYNCFCDHMRSAKRYTAAELEDNILCSSDAEKPYANQELHMALSRLGENEKTCILLFYMEDKSIKDISVITGFKENTVKSHLLRAKANLSEHLKSIGYERG